MPLIYFPLLAMALALGWAGTRTALYLRHAKGSRRDEYFLLVLSWGPLFWTLLSLLLTLSGSNP